MNTKELHDYLESRGFEVQETGGGCKAFAQVFSEPEMNAECLIIDDEGPALPLNGEEMRIVLIVNGEDVGECYGGLSEIIHFWEYTASEIYAEKFEAGNQ